MFFAGPGSGAGRTAGGLAPGPDILTLRTSVRAAAARKGIEPSIYALSTLMFIAVLVLLLIVNKRSSLEDVS